MADGLAKRTPLAKLREAEWNANRCSPATLAKIRRSIEEFGIVENLVARPHPSEHDCLEVLSGNHRLRVLLEMGVKAAPVVVVDLDDAHARVLAQALNRTRGKDDPEALARLLEAVLAEMPVAEVTQILPDTEGEISRLLRQFGPEEEQSVPEPPAEPRSKPGEVYELGAHRLMCGNATDAEQVAELLGGEAPVLLLTDPPYGVELDGEWRDRALRTSYLRTEGHRNTSISGDTVADWSHAYTLVPSVNVAYIWHASARASEVQAGLESIDFEIVQQIIWRKNVATLSRQHYHWQHEACWYARRKGAKVPWLGGFKQSTVWDVPSPKAIMGGSTETKVDHPTQKPVVVYTIPIENHLEPGECFYEPFAGSGTALIAAEMTGRRCLAMELDPVFCDVIRDRYEAFVQKESACAA